VRRCCSELLRAISQSVFTDFLFPHADFVQELAKLGYSADDGITNLMLFVAYCEDE